MLLLSDRQTEKDLQLWKEYEEIDKITSYSQKKVELTKNAILDFCRLHDDVVIYTSWGKDSIVLLYFIAVMKITFPVLYVRFDDRDNPDCELVRDAFLEKYNLNYHEESYDYHRVRKSGLHWKETAEKYGQHRISGIRNDESGRRLLNWKMYGFYSEYSCRPLSLWTNKEIFAFIEQNNLPLCPVYAYLGGGRWPRENIRTHSLAGSTADGFGRTEWEREYYPDILNKIKAGKNN